MAFCDIKILVGLAVVLFFVLVLVRPWRIAAFEDMREAAAQPPEDAAKAAKADAELKYAGFRKWVTDFCSVWTEVLGKAKQADQSSQSDAAYIQTLEAKHSVKLYRCDAVSWPEALDLTFLDANLPADASIFKSTLSFMDTQIASIKANTAAALQGKPPAAGFADYVPDCQLSPSNILTCKFPIKLQPTADKMAEMVARLTKLAEEISALQPMFLKVKQGVADLNSIGQQAQSGALLASATPLA